MCFFYFLFKIQQKANKKKSNPPKKRSNYNLQNKFVINDINDDFNNEINYNYKTENVDYENEENKISDNEENKISDNDNQNNQFGSPSTLIIKNQNKLNKKNNIISLKEDIKKRYLSKKYNKEMKSTGINMTELSLNSNENAEDLSKSSLTNKKKEKSKFMKENLTISKFQNTKLKEKPILKNIENESIKTILEDNEYDFTDDDLDNLALEDAKNIDKRTFCYFYWNQIKDKEDVINMIFNSSNLESYQIRVIIFLFGMSLYFFINALFFIESYIANIFLRKGKYSFMEVLENEFKRCLYSQIISFIVDMFENCMNNPTKRLEICLKKEKDPIIYLKKSSLILKSMRKLHFIFLIFNFCLMFLFWYFLSAFCVVKYNSRFNWLVGGLITFFITNCFPFLTCLLITSLRFLGMKIKCCGFFYRLSQWLM